MTRKHPTTIAQAVAELRSQLLDAETPEDVRGAMKVESVELELGLELEQSDEAEFGVRWMLLGGGYKDGSRNAARHTVKIRLTPTNLSTIGHRQP